MLALSTEQLDDISLSERRVYNNNNNNTIRLFIIGYSSYTCVKLATQGQETCASFRARFYIYIYLFEQYDVNT